MQIIALPRFTSKITFYWLMPTPKGNKATKRIRETVRLPFWVWWGRNVTGEFKDLWIERTVAPMRGKGNKLVDAGSFRGDEAAVSPPA